MEKTPIHVWEGPEEELACCCHATRFTIDHMEKNYAEGIITAKDYIEHGIVFSDPWEAVPDGRGGWTVKRKKDETSFWVNRETGEVLFTVNSSINKAMKVFISDKIKSFIETGKSIISPEKYSGAMQEYAGPCVCNKFEQGGILISFLWKELTGGNFPERCFACSCGTKWWCFSPSEHLWDKVNDDKAWKMLITYNGVDVERVVSLEGQGGFKLLQTLRDAGFIPIG